MSSFVNHLRAPHRVAALAALAAVAATPFAHAQNITVPIGFKATILASGLSKPNAIAVAPDGRIFIAQQNGLVRVWQNGVLLATPFIDLRDETGFNWDRGMLGIALDPEWSTNRLVYMLLIVDPIPGQPDEPSESPAIGRVVRYGATLASDGNVADLATRHVVLGHGPEDGIPCCYSSHSVGALRFGLDGSLLVSSGDGASFNVVDSGGDPACAALFGAETDIGAFRSQRMDCLAGKLLRIDPQSGEGLPDNPYFTGNPDDARSKIWASGLRNPFRFTVIPGTPGPGTIYVSDVGWNLREEVSRVLGGENLGWPCFEGIQAPPGYPTAAPANSGCSTLSTPANPGPVTAPLLQWHHSNSAQSVPPGYLGNCAVVGAWQDDPRVPPSYRGLYLADWSSNWIRLFKPDPVTGGLGSLSTFATLAQQPSDFAIDPTTGDIIYVAMLQNRVMRIRWNGPDLNGSGVVDGADLGVLLGKWGQADQFADLNFDGVVNGADVGLLLAAWSG